MIAEEIGERRWGRGDGERREYGRRGDRKREREYGRRGVRVYRKKRRWRGDRKRERVWKKRRWGEEIGEIIADEVVISMCVRDKEYKE